MSYFLPAVGFATVAINYVFEPTTKKKQVRSRELKHHHGSVLNMSRTSQESCNECFSDANETVSCVQVIPSPTAISDLMDQLPVVQVEKEDDDDDDDNCPGVLMSICLHQGRSRPIRVLNRLTIMMSDSSHFVSATAFFSHLTCFIDPINIQVSILHATVCVCSEK